MAYELLRDDKMNETVANLSGVKGSVRKTANEMRVIVEGRLAPHRKTGQARIEVSYGKTDAYVSLVDPAALSIEFGHYLGNEELGSKRYFVRGLHLFIDWYSEGL